MTSDRHIKHNGWMLGIAIALAATSACAATSVLQAAAPQSPVNLAASFNTETTPKASLKPLSRGYRPGEAGVRKAAMQGPEALRRYIWRTRMIYDYYFWDFAKQQ